MNNYINSLTNILYNKFSYENINQLHKKIQYKKNNILIAQLRGLGDFIYIIPLLKTLYYLEPNTNIIFLCYKDIKDLVVDYPYIHKIIYIDDYIKDINFDNLININNLVINDYIQLISLIKDLLYNGFITKAINVGADYNDLINIIFYLTGAKVRAANANSEILDKKLLTDILVTPNNITHTININMYFLQHLYNKKFYPKLDWDINKKKYINIKNKNIVLNGTILNGSKIIHICIGTGAASLSKKYSHYKKLIIELNKLYNNIIFHIIGDEKINLPNCINYNINIEQVISIISQCNLYIGNDTCYVHFAAIFKIPCIILYKESQDKYNFYTKNNLDRLITYNNWYPYNNLHIPIRPQHSKFPCNKQQFIPSGCRIEKPHCINNITIDDIIKAIKLFIPIKNGPS